jgi:hypothetical protein
MENWLKCTVSIGQFGSEYGVDGVQFNDKPFSLFVPKDSVKFSEEPSKEKPVPGWVRVQIVSRDEDMILVLLPRPTFQSGPYVTVKPDQLEKPVKKEPARRQRQARS